MKLEIRLRSGEYEHRHIIRREKLFGVHAMIDP